MATLIHTPGSIEISTEGPVSVPMGDVESTVTDPSASSEELPSVEIYVEIPGDSDDDDSEDGDLEEGLPEAAAENQQVNIMFSLPHTVYYCSFSYPCSLKWECLF